jgi:pantoate--beta-alanine ligase
MRIARTAADLRRACGSAVIAFVPTMGALHEGHLALVRRARALAERVVVSIFVNPTQFGPGEDFDRYPRQPESDGALLETAGCDVLFLPDVETIYPRGHATFVDPAGAALGLEGALRPGHFRGVATVVTQLFGLVQPRWAIFGEKDAQQLAVIRQAVRDLHLPVEIVAHPTVREADGLAMSSRNRFLGPEERRAAAVLFRALGEAGERIAGGERSAARLRQRMAAAIAAEPLVRLQYAEVVAADTFQPLEQAVGRIVLPVAATVGSTRLIDNLQFALDGHHGGV